jgi:hypothetical protein
MKAKVYLLIFIGIIAISVAVFGLITVDPKNETWTSVAVGAVMGCLIAIGMRYIKNRNVNKA